MPGDENGGQGKSKPEMIRDVLEGDPDLPAPKIRAAVWDRFGGEVTTQEIAHVRKKMRQSTAAAPPVEAPRTEVASRKSADRAKNAAPGRKKKPAAAIRARDYAAADVTVKQLSAILEVAEQVGGLRRLHEAIRTVMLLRDKVGDVDERQLAVALDFLARLTGRK
jgi:hypothetical protein